MKAKITILSLLVASASTMFADELQRNTIYVNTDVTTHIMMPENLKLVDISTTEIAGNQCADNMIRIKPILTDSIGNKQMYSKDQFLGTVTLIGERHVVQYDIKYATDPMKANAMFRVNYDDSYNYSNPETTMPESEMARLAWTAYGSKRKFHNIRNTENGIQAEVYNIYTVGDYFFIDFVLKNKTKIPYDIQEMRVNLTDKKQTKATNFQSIELSPIYILNTAKRFNKGYRQVIVLDKLTFPDEKILNIEIAENQISGRAVTLPIQYQDILNADCFDMDKINSDQNLTVKSLEKRESELQKKYEALCKDNTSLKAELDKTKNELHLIQQKLKRFRKSVENTLETMNLEMAPELINDIQLADVGSVNK